MRIDDNFLKQLNEAIQLVVDKQKELFPDNHLCGTLNKVYLSDDMIKCYLQQGEHIFVIKKDMPKNLIDKLFQDKMSKVLDVIFEYIDSFTKFFFRSKYVDVLEVYFNNEGLHVVYLDKEYATITETFDYKRVNRFISRNKQCKN